MRVIVNRFFIMLTDVHKVNIYVTSSYIANEKKKSLYVVFEFDEIIFMIHRLVTNLALRRLPCGPGMEHITLVACPAPSHESTPTSFL